MYELTIERTFSAAHHLRDYDGPCARLHGHNYRVQITVGGEHLGSDGMLVDFGELKGICDAVLVEYDHRCLNDLPAFATLNPTAENIACTLYHAVEERLQRPGVTVLSVALWENDGSHVIFRGGPCR
jgi:6-pyruvoyltetrahydropterin/6-carboxytetrahydropterin synthase